MVSVSLRFIIVFGLMALTACDSLEERVARHHDRGLALANQGAFAKASLEFRNALKLDPSFTPAHFEMAKLLERDNQLSAALRHLSKIVEIDPSHVSARVKLAQIMLFADYVDASKEHVTKALAIAPDHPIALATQGAIALRLGDETTAIGSAGRALAIDPNAMEAGMVLVGARMRAEQWTEALALADGYLTIAPKNVALHIAKLQIHEAMQDDEAVTAHLLQLTERLPEEPQFRRMLSRHYDRMGDIESAEAQMRALAAAEPDNSDLALDVVRYLMRARGKDSGRAELERLIAQGQNGFPFRMVLSELELDNGSQHRATALLQKIIAEDPDSGNVTTARTALARAMLVDGDTISAREQVDLILSSDGTHLDALAIRASLRIKDTDYDGAIQDTRLGLAEAPGNVALLRLEAHALELSGNPALAGERLSAAVSASRHETGVVQSYLQFLLRQNRMTAAQAILQDARQRSPEDPGLLTMRGHLRATDKAPGGAEAKLRTRLAAIPDDPALLVRLAKEAEDQGRFGDAIEIYRKLLETRPESLALANNYASLVADHKADDPIALDRAHALAIGLRMSEIPQFQDTYGWLQYLRGDYEEAIRYLAPAIDAMPENPWIQYHTGMTYAKLEQHAAARQHLQAAAAMARRSGLPKLSDVEAALAALPDR